MEPIPVSHDQVKQWLHLLKWWGRALPFSKHLYLSQAELSSLHILYPPDLFLQMTNLLLTDSYIWNIYSMLKVVPFLTLSLNSGGTSQNPECTDYKICVPVLLEWLLYLLIFFSSFRISLGIHLKNIQHFSINNSHWFWCSNCFILGQQKTMHVAPVSFWDDPISFGALASFLSSSRCFRLILHFLWPRSGISHTSKEPLVLFSGELFLETTTWVFIAVGVHSCWVVLTFKPIHGYICIFEKI